jgi:4'-phosphopantetheinyl transferase
VSATTEWRETSNPPSLGPFEIHLWRIDLHRDPAETARLESCLIPSERERATRFHFPQDRRRFVVRRAVLRHLLGNYAGCCPEAVCLAHTAHGKPFLEHQEAPDALRFSSSHSADLALIAFARGREVGVDLEFHRPLPEAAEMAKAFFSASEIAELAQVPEAAKQKIFFDGWARKEAFVKAIGLGLSFPLNHFSVSLSPGQPAALLQVEHDPAAVERWSMQAIDASPNCSAALVGEGKDLRVAYLEWSPRPQI